MVVRRAFPLVLLLPLAAILAVATSVNAQPFEVEGVTYNLTKTLSTIAGVGPAGIALKSSGSPSQIVVSDRKLAELKKSTIKPGDPPITTQISIVGKAETSFLAKDQYVTFTAELKNGKGVEPVTQMTMFTAKTAKDLSMIAGEGGAWAATGMPNGTFLISGQITAFGKGQMTVAAPNDKGKKVKIAVSVPVSLKIAVNIADLSVVQPGDTVDAAGYIGTPKGGQPQNIMLAETLKIALAKPLMSRVKRRELASAASTAKGGSASEPAKEKPAAAEVDKPVEGLRDPSMPDKPALQAESESDEKIEEAAKTAVAEEELIVDDTFVVDENHAPEK